MAPLAFLLLFVVTAYLFLYRTRPTHAQGDASLDGLPLRSLDQALVPADGTGDDDEKSVLYAVVLVDANPTLDLPAILRTANARWGAAPAEALRGEDTPPLRRELVAPAGRIAFELIAPLRDHAPFADAVADGGSDGRSLAAHAAAVLVSVEADKASVAQAVALSQQVYALLDTCPQATAVFWSASHTLLAASQAKRALGADYEARFPVGLWVSARADRLDDGRVQGYTLGLSALGRTEFEALDAREGPKALRERLQGLAQYSLLSCRTIFNGDTTGVDGCERIRLQKVPSQTVHRGWVFQLRYQNASPQQPWESE